MQGSFCRHGTSLERLGVASREVRRPEELEGLTHLIIPGGESTTFHRLASEYGLLEPLTEAIGNGLAVLGTCAGAILLGTGSAVPPRLGVAPVTVIRNAYGRQKESFTAELSIAFLNRPFKGVFIRAPKIVPPQARNEELEILARLGEDPVLVRYRRILLCTFHPELTEDDSIHQYFMSL
jgi:5'-phosphate synthase pdxT subunit